MSAPALVVLLCPETLLSCFSSRLGTSDNLLISIQDKIKGEDTMSELDKKHKKENEERLEEVKNALSLKTLNLISLHLRIDQNSPFNIITKLFVPMLRQEKTRSSLPSSSRASSGDSRLPAVDSSPLTSIAGYRHTQQHRRPLHTTDSIRFRCDFLYPAFV
ncbi:unnamed protein product [Lactuca virosa]|uniref:Uncharacterized protein n=1 Tax=Lactuca virosa TaxID=75947 RepID=A0AAU9PJC2_9ASTR|nr:unnamed protein product [Lactuca virosa]